MTLEEENKKLREALLDAYEERMWDMFSQGGANEFDNTFDHCSMNEAKVLLIDCDLKADTRKVDLDKLKERMKELPQKWLDEVLSK